jgi:hypothetical protein
LVTAEDSLFFQAVPFWGDNFFHIFFHSLRPELGRFFNVDQGKQKTPKFGVFLFC